MTIETTTTSLADRARAAFNDQGDAETARLAEDHAAQVRLIREALAELGIEPAHDPLFNPISRRMCVPLIVGGITTEEYDSREEPVFTHTVAAEWDDDIDDPGLVLVANLESEGRHTDTWLYPAGRLRRLADVGAALEYGGNQYTTAPLGIQGDVSRSIDAAQGAAANATGYEAIAMTHAANAICIALLDVAAAIRETGRD